MQILINMVARGRAKRNKVTATKSNVAKFTCFLYISHAKAVTLFATAQAHGKAQPELALKSLFCIASSIAKIQIFILFHVLFVITSKL